MGVIMRHSYLISLIALIPAASCARDEGPAPKEKIEAVTEITVYTFGQPQMLLPQEAAARTFEESRRGQQ